MRTVAVLGAGNMGTALAQVIAGNGHRALLWSIETDVLEEVRDRRLNSRYLPGVALHPQVIPCWTLQECLAETRLAVLCVPSQVVRSLARQVAPHIGPEQAALNAAKGLEEGSQKRLSEVLAEELPQHAGVAAMGGPAIATEFARGVPTAVIVGAADASLAAEVQDALQNEFFKVETTADLAGVELGGCLKNVYAIALGMCDGLDYGGNTKAFVATVALAELAALSGPLGVEERTVYGLAGLGDLLTTGYDVKSRNRTLGEKLCRDPNWAQFLHTQTVEGVPACRTAKELAQRLGVATPLLDVVHDVLFGGEPPAERMPRFLREFWYS